MTTTKTKRRTNQALEEDVIEPLIVAWIELGLSTTNKEFDRLWSEATNVTFNKLWINVDPEVAEEVHNLLYNDFQQRNLSRFGQVVFHHAYALVRLLDHIENAPLEPADAEIARCAMMFYAGVHFGRNQIDFWTLYLQLRDAVRRAKPALFSVENIDAPNTPSAEATELAAQAWDCMDKLYGTYYLPRWRPNLAASALSEPDKFSATLLLDAAALRD